MAVYVVKQKTGEKELAAKGQKQVAGLVLQRKEKKRNEFSESILLVFVIPSTLKRSHLHPHYVHIHIT
jgi:hypothetical protein